jgi:hypothetical protein
MHHHHHLDRVLLLLVIGNVDPDSLILVNLMMEVICFSETSALTRASRRNNPGDGILHSHRRETIKSFLQLQSYNYPTFIVN